MKAAQISSRPLRAAYTTLLAVLLCASSLQAADANPPARLTYQGYLTDGDGNTLAAAAPKNYNVVFRVFNTQSGGSSLWSEQQTLTVDKGYFSVLLGEGGNVGAGGSVEPRPSLSTLFSATDASDRFVEVTVLGIGTSGADVTILPRIRLLTSPYAFLSQHSVTAGSLVNASASPVISVVDNTVSIANPLAVTGKITTTGGGADFAGDVTTTGNLKVTSGGITVSGNIASTSGDLSGRNVTASGTVTATGNITTAGAFVGSGTIPIGGIIMWSGSIASIPSGWALCNGQNSTPNLTDRFVLGAGNSYQPNNAAGSSTAALSVENLPSHKHTISQNTWQSWTWVAWSGGNGGQAVTGAGTISTDATGSNQPFSIMPPYWALAYIMRTR
jgi:hypothetical protein